MSALEQTHRWIEHVRSFGIGLSLVPDTDFSGDVMTLQFDDIMDPLALWELLNYAALNAGGREYVNEHWVSFVTAQDEFLTFSVTFFVEGVPDGA